MYTCWRTQPFFLSISPKNLMHTGRVEANQVRLNEESRLPYVPELIARKIEGAEKSMLPDADVSFHRSEYERLTRELEAASEVNQLPERPSARAGLNDLLIRLRT